MSTKIFFAVLIFAAAESYAGDAPALHLTGNPQVDFFGGVNLAGNHTSRTGPSQPLMPTETAGGEKNPWIAGLLSLAVPGAGEWYSDSKLKGAVFFGVEVASWVTAHIYDKKGDHQTDVFQDFANEHYNASQYALWTMNHLGALNPDLAGDKSSYFGLIFPNGDSTEGPPYRNMNWEELNSMERDIAVVGNGYTHELPYWGQQQFYELIGKYEQFSRGWDDSDPADPPNKVNPIQSTSKEMFVYAAMRANANHYYDISATFVSIAVINHIVSALDAYLTTKSHNTALHAEVNMRIQPTPVGLVPVSEARIQYSF
jgi:hypothetical protein